MLEVAWYHFFPHNWCLIYVLHVSGISCLLNVKTKGYSANNEKMNNVGDSGLKGKHIKKVLI